MTTQKRALTAIYIIAFVLLMHQLTATTIAYIINSFPDLPRTTVQQIVSLPSIVGLIVSLIIGPLALKVNKKYLAMFAASMLLIYFAIFSLMGNKSITPLLVATVFAGIAHGSAVTLISSMIGEFVGAEKSADYVSAGIGLMNAGIGFMSIVGGAIAARNGGEHWPQAYYLGVLLVPAIIAFGVLMPKKPDAPAEARRAQASGEAASSPPEKESLPLQVIVIAVLMIFSYIGICGYLFFISVYIVNEYKLGTSMDAGIVNTVTTITTLITGLTYAVWAKLFKKLFIVISYSVAALALFCMMTFTTTLFGAFAAAILLGWSFNTIRSYGMGFVMRITPPRLVPVGLSVFMVGSNIGQFTSIYVLNFLSGFLGGGLHNILLLCTVGLAVCAAAAFFVYRTKDIPAQASRTAEA
ncbi:MAG: MFS transporter [Spirochaetaceae bacterium]|jgi:MFS family permease|nr:MFS transporter [Spirochaetaceae bacterium]